LDRRTSAKRAAIGGRQQKDGNRHNQGQQAGARPEQRGGGNVGGGGSNNRNNGGGGGNNNRNNNFRTGSSGTAARNSSNTHNTHSAHSGSNAKKGEQHKGKPRLRVIPLGGLDGIGKNMTVFEYGNDMIVVDAGLMFPDDDHPGVDLILPDYTYILENAERLRAIIITHGHEDHTGALPYLLKDLNVASVQIMGSKLTLGFIEGKFVEHQIKNPRFREIQAGEHVAIGSFGCDFFSVNHSIPASLGLFIRTPAGNVLHTGDFKLDQTPIDGVHTDFAAISRFAKVGVDLMLSDSTNANNPNFTKSEAEVGKVLKQIIASASQRVIVASFSSHIHRIQQVCDAAVAAGRSVAVTGRSMLTNTKIARELGYLKVSESLLIDAYAAKDIPPNKLVVLCTGSQGEPLSALARMANGEHRTVDIERGDTVIISATPVPGNEKAVTRVVNALSKIGAEVFDKQRALVHVSGHAGSEELKLMIALAQPSYFMPVHGEALHLRAHAGLAEGVGVPAKNIFILDSGDTLLLGEDGIKRGETVESGVVYVDGLSVGDVSAVVLKDRQTLASDGIVTLVCTLRRRDSAPVGKPEVIMRGVSGGDDVDLTNDLVNLAERTVSRFAHEYRSNPNSLKRALREQIASLLWERARRRPMIIPLIMDV
jgi:ribonuclease J